MNKNSTTIADLQKLLRIAVQKSAVEIVRWLIQHHKESLQQPATAIPLLHSACAEGHVEIVHLLLEVKKEISVNDVDKAGRTILAYLAEQYMDRYQSTDAFRSAPTAGYAEIASLLCQNGANHTMYSAIVFLKAEDVELIFVIFVFFVFFVFIPTNNEFEHK